MWTWPFVISTIFHIVLFVALYFHQNLQSKQSRFQAINIEMLEPVPQVKASRPGFGQITKGSQKKPTLQLFPSYSSSLHKAFSRPADQFQNESKSANYYPEFDSAGGLSVTQIGSIKSLWNEVDKAIEDNPYLSEFGHTGSVLLRFEMTPEGKIADRTLRVEARNPILKVIALRALRKALRNEKQQLRLPPNNIVLTAQFTWSDYETCRSLKGTYRNSLNFCSYAENKLKNFSKKEKALTYLSSLQYGFSAGDEIKKYNQEQSRHKNGFDPFEHYRRDPDWETGS